MRELRTREYLTEPEIERLLKAVKANRWAQRDAAMILVTYRHGLRASEVTDLRWDQVEFETATLHVRRVKQGSPARIRSSAMSYACYASCSGSRSRILGLCSRPSAARRSR